jgi:hypothetical protein
MSKHRLKHLLVFVFLGLAACAEVGGGNQFTNKVTAPSFVSKLYSSQTQVVSVHHAEASHITWLGFVQSNDYKYFKITKVQVGNQTLVAEGMENNGEKFMPTPNAIVRDINVSGSATANNEYVNGSINVAGVGDLKVSIKYSPLKAVKDDAEPHEAYLVIYYDKPSVGAMRVKITGFTQGVNNQACTRDPSTMVPVVYEFKNNTFDFYMCGQEVIRTNQNNIATLPATDPGYHGTATNLTPISTIDAQGQSQFLTFYQVDADTVCMLSEDLAGEDSSIPNFTFLIPEGLAPIDHLDIKMAEGSFAECTLTNGVIDCADNIQIDTGVVPVSPLSATNAGYTADETVTSECPDFGPLQGSGNFGDDDLTLVLKGTVLSDPNTQAYHIVDGLVGAHIPLKCVSGC